MNNFENLDTVIETDRRNRDSIIEKINNDEGVHKTMLEAIDIWMHNQAA